MIAADLSRVEVWVATTPVDMRKSFDGLAEVVRAFLQRDPQSGHLFVFRNKGGHLLKILCGIRAAWPSFISDWNAANSSFPRSGEMAVEISREELLRLLSGMSLAKRRSE